MSVLYFKDMQKLISIKNIHYESIILYIFICSLYLERSKNEYYE